MQHAATTQGEQGDEGDEAEKGKKAFGKSAGQLITCKSIRNVPLCTSRCAGAGGPGAQPRPASWRRPRL